MIEILYFVLVMFGNDYKVIKINYMFKCNFKFFMSLGKWFSLYIVFYVDYYFEVFYKNINCEFNKIREII